MEANIPEAITITGKPKFKEGFRIKMANNNNYVEFGLKNDTFVKVLSVGNNEGSHSSPNKYFVQDDNGKSGWVNEPDLKWSRNRNKANGATADPDEEKSESEPVEETAPAEPQPVVAYSNTSHDIKGQDDKKELLRLAANENMPVLLVGDTGTGKTSIVKGMADEFQKEYIRFNLTGETTVDEFVGKYVLENNQTKWEDGILLQAMKQGKWLIVDEVNVALPEILFVLHSLLDDDKFVVVANHNGEVVRPHDDFRFFGTMNPVDEYAGTKDLNKAFKSRFNMILYIDYPEPKIEAEIIQQKCGIDEKTALLMTDTAVVIRELKKEDKIFYTCSTRDLIQWGNLVKHIGEQRAFEVAILGKANGDGEIVADAYGKMTGHYKQVKKNGYMLNIDEIQRRTEELRQKEEQFKNNRDVIEAEVRGDILKKLGMGA